MAVPKRRTSKMKKRIRKASHRFRGIQIAVDSEGNAYIPHRVNPLTGKYKGRQVISLDN